MKTSTKITTAEHSLLCNQTYVDFLKSRISQSTYINLINSHTELASDRLYRSFESRKIREEEFAESKSTIIRIHNAYLKKGNLC